MSIDPYVSRRGAYDRVCESYHAVDDFRMKLLGLLPVATGTGVFLLLSGKAELLNTGGNDSGVREAFAAIGVFGFLFTLGLFAYELFGIKKCHYLIWAGSKLESSLDVQGQFRSRPHAIAGLVNEPFASAIIYPASMAAWLFVALIFTTGASWAAAVAFAVVVLGCTGTLIGSRHMKANHGLETEIRELLGMHGQRSRDELVEEVAKILHERRRHRKPEAAPPGKARRRLKRTWIRRTVHRLEKHGEIIIRHPGGSLAADHGQPLPTDSDADGVS